MSKYEKFSKDELVALVEKQDNELASKKYGLVWDSEREPEQVVLDCEYNLPVLKRVDGKEIKTDDSQDNILIEGDNYHALTVLNYTHQNKIDVIYIDPPYNTGKAKEWRYNDKYVDENDGYKHSKWLSMMDKRLRLAKNLLSEGGVIFISINDYEYSQLKLLLDSIFEEKNFIDNFIIRSNPRGNQAKKFTASEHEYLICYAKNIKLFKPLGFIKNKKEYNKKDEDGIYREMGLRKRGAGSRRIDAPNQYYPIYFNVKTGEIDIKRNTKEDIEIFPRLLDGTDGRWRWSFKSVMKDRKKLLIRLVNRTNGKEYDVFEKDYFDVEKISKIKSIFYEKNVNYENATEELKEMFNSKIFEYPKPIYLIYKLLESLEETSQTVLDFFAGSGTTGHAVLKINKKDGGNRKFILCTNNENNICEEVTYPRIKSAITGYKFNGKEKTIIFEKKITFSQLKNVDKILKEVNNVVEKNKLKFDEIKHVFEGSTIKIVGINSVNGKKDGLSGNLQYFKTDLVKQTKNKDQVRIDLTEKCTEMLCVKENIFNQKILKTDYKIFSSNDNKKFLGVYYNLFDESLKDFIKEIKKLKGEKIIYMFSVNGKTDRSLFLDIPNCIIEEIPQKIIELYKDLVKMNIPLKSDLIFMEFEKANKIIFDEGEKDEGARILRIVLEKIIQKIAQKEGVNIFKDNNKEEKIVVINDILKSSKVFNQVKWEENKTYLTIGNHASHGEYNEYTLNQVKNFYKHIQTLLNSFNL